MMRFLRGLRGAIGMGVAWGVGWALGGLLVALTSVVTPFLPWDVFFGFWDAPVLALAMPGFIAGVLFSGVLAITGRRHRFAELSLPRFALWGALGGLLLSLLPGAMVAVGLASVEGGRFTVLQLTGIIVAPLVLLGAASAAGSLALARRAEAHALKTGDAGAIEAS